MHQILKSKDKQVKNVSNIKKKIVINKNNHQLQTLHKNYKVIMQIITNTLHLKQSSLIIINLFTKVE